MLRKEVAALVGRSTLQPRAVTMIVQNLLIKFCLGNLETDNHYEDADNCYWKVFLSGSEMGKMMNLELSSDEDEEG